MLNEDRIQTKCQDFLRGIIVHYAGVINWTFSICVGRGLYRFGNQTV